LHFGCHLSDFVEEDGPVSRSPQSPWPGDSARERAFRDAEKLAGLQRVDNGAAVDDDHEIVARRLNWWT